MPDRPSHQDTGADVSDPAIAATSRRRRLLIAAVLVVLVAAVVVLHLTGAIGAGGHS